MDSIESDVLHSKMLDLVLLNYNDSETCIKYVSRVSSYSTIKHIVIVDND